MVYIDTITEKDLIGQISRCSFDVHVQDIMGTLMIGGTLVMLRPRGNIDFDYFYKTIRDKQITFMHTTPSLLYSFFSFLQDSKHLKALECLRSVSSGGMKSSNEF